VTGVDELAARTDALVREAAAAVEEAERQSDALEQNLALLRYELWGGGNG
jgi:hypothetical protein